jgi:hypothetical protein
LPRINLVGLIEIGSKDLGTVLISTTTSGEGVVFDGSATEEMARKIIATFAHLLETKDLFDFEVDDMHGDHLEGHGRMAGFRSQLVSSSVPEIYRYFGSFTKL